MICIADSAIFWDFNVFRVVTNIPFSEEHESGDIQSIF
jgi:hypothetical protein